MNGRSEWLANSLCFVRHSGVAWLLIPQIVHGGCELDSPLGVAVVVVVVVSVFVVVIVVVLLVRMFGV